MRDTDACRAGPGGPFLARKDWNEHCDGGCAPLALHVRQLKPAPERLCAPVSVFHFDCNNPAAAYPDVSSVVHDVAATGTGIASAVVVWWELFLEPLRTAEDIAPVNVLSTAPDGEYYNNSSNWQDHWCPILFPLPRPLPLEVGEPAQLLAAHTLTSMWFKAGSAPRAAKAARSDQCDDIRMLSSDPDVCTCGLHHLANWERLMQLNDAGRSDALIRAAVAAIESARVGTSSVICVDVSGTVCVHCYVTKF